MTISSKKMTHFSNSCSSICQRWLKIAAISNISFPTYITLSEMCYDEILSSKFLSEMTYLKNSCIPEQLLLWSNQLIASETVCIYTNKWIVLKWLFTWWRLGSLILAKCEKWTESMFCVWFCLNLWENAMTTTIAPYRYFQ